MRNQKFFKAEEVSWVNGTFVNISSITHTKKAPAGKKSGVFLLDPLKNVF